VGTEEARTQPIPFGATPDHCLGSISLNWQNFSCVYGRYVYILSVYTLLLSQQIKGKTNNRTILSLLVSPTIVEEVFAHVSQGFVQNPISWAGKETSVMYFG